MALFQVLIERVQDYNDFGGAQYKVRECKPIEEELPADMPKAITGEQPRTCYLLCNEKYGVGKFINPRKALGIPKAPKKRIEAEPTADADESAFNWPAPEEHNKSVHTAEIIELVPLHPVIDQSVTRDPVIENDNLDMSVFDRQPMGEAPDNLIQFRPKL